MRLPSICAVLATCVLTMTVASVAGACDAPVSVCATSAPGSFALIHHAQPASIVVDATADTAVRRVADSFAADLQRVSGTAARRIMDVRNATGDIVIIGVVGRSPVIDRLVRAGKLDVRDVVGQWEAFRQVVVERPFPAVTRALVIAGGRSPRRDLRHLRPVGPDRGVALVLVRRRSRARRRPTCSSPPVPHRDAPRVKYRGFFINDEAPAMTALGAEAVRRLQREDVRARVRAAPAAQGQLPVAGDVAAARVQRRRRPPEHGARRRHGRRDGHVAPRADDAGARRVAPAHRRGSSGGVGLRLERREPGSILARGHRAHDAKPDGSPYESVVTIGMRGDGDEAMAEGTAIGLLETIVASQRRIIAEVTGKPADQHPAGVGALQGSAGLLRRGMNVPDDVDLLFADDNWGQVRRLPTSDRNRTGRYGVYYHFDYVGAPRNYKWLNTIPIEKTWEQMDLAYARNARALWIVNVGDIKPMEFPFELLHGPGLEPGGHDRRRAHAVSRAVGARDVRHVAGRGDRRPADPIWQVRRTAEARTHRCGVFPPRSLERRDTGRRRIRGDRRRMARTGTRDAARQGRVAAGSPVRLPATGRASHHRAVEPVPAVLRCGLESSSRRVW